MRPLEIQQSLVEQYSAIPDLHERMMLIVDRARRLPAMTEAERTEEARVKGCVSRVWLRGGCAEGGCSFRVDADSAVVRGLAAFVCAMYEGAPPEEVLATEPELLERLGIAENLSPTRRHGLAQVRVAMRGIAQAALEGRVA